MKKESVFKRTQREYGFPIKKTNFRKAVKAARGFMHEPKLSQSEAMKVTYVVRDIMYD